MRRTLTGLVILWVILPLLVLGTIYLAISTIFDAYQISNRAQAQAQRVSSVVAVVAKSEPFSPGLIADQTNAFLVNSPLIETINFYPLSVAVPIRQSNPSVFSSRITASSPVESDQSSGTHLSGYINVTMDIWPEQKKLLFTSGALLVLLLFTMGFSSFWVFQLLGREGRFSVFSSLNGLMAQARDQEPLQNLDLNNLSPIVNIAAVERVLMDLDSRLQHSRQQAVDLQVELSELRDKMANEGLTKTSFQSMVTHELRNPLHAMSGGLQLLDTQLFSGENLQAIHLVEQGLRQIEHLLDQVIELSELQESYVKSQESEVAIEPFLRQIAQGYAAQLMEKGLNLTLGVNHKPTDVLVDADKLKAILGYLIDNAIKFTNKGGLSIESELSLTKWPNKLNWRIRVIDSGIGINEQALKRIFDPYFQADSSKLREFEGVGLGLTLAQKTSEIIGAKIEVQSKPDSGSEFAVELMVTHSELNIAKSSLEGLLILSLQNRDSVQLERELESAGANVMSFDAQAMALVSFEERSYDMVLIGQTLDTPAALSFASRCREMELNHRATIVYISSEDLDLEELRVGGIDRVSAPFTPQILINQLANWKI